MILLTATSAATSRLYGSAMPSTTKQSELNHIIGVGMQVNANATEGHEW